MNSRNSKSTSKYFKLRCHDPDDDKKQYISPHIQNDIFLGENLVLGAEELIITEGIPDWYSAIDKGFKAISPATVGFRTKDIEKLVKLTAHTKVIYIINDNEQNNAGYEGAKKTAEALARNGRLVYIVKLPRPDGMDKVDLNEYLKTHTAEDLQKLMQDADSIFDILIGELPSKQEIALSDLGGKIVPLLLNQPEPIIAKVKQDIIAKTKLDKSIINTILKEGKEAVRDQETNVKLEEEIKKLNEEFAVINIGGKTRILHEQEDTNNHGQINIHFKAESDFHLLLKNRTVCVGGKVKSLSELWLRDADRREYEQIVFEPCIDMGSRYYNLWRGFAVKPVPGNCALYLNHIRENICKGNGKYFNYLIAWMADAVQNPNNRPGVAIVLRGDRGTGKNIFVDFFGSLFGDGRHYQVVTQTRHLVGNFNEHLKDCLILFANEAFWAGDKAGENVLKSLITDNTIMVEPKGKDVIQLPNKMRILMASNNEWIIPAGIDERRYFVLEVADKHKQDKDYFGEIVDQMENGGKEALLYYLQSFDLSNIDLRSIPQTKALLNQKLKSMDYVEKFWYESLHEGILSYDDGCWEPEITVNQLYENYSDFAKLSRGRPVTKSEFGKKIKKMCPPVQKKYISINMIEKSTRTNAYVFPALEICRKVLEKYINMEIEWPDDLDAKNSQKVEDFIFPNKLIRQPLEKKCAPSPITSF